MEHKKHYGFLLLTRNPGQSIYVGEHLKVSYESFDRDIDAICLKALYKNLKDTPLSGGTVYIREHSKFELFNLSMRLGEGINILHNARMFYHSRSPGGKQIQLGFDAPSSVGIWRDDIKERTTKLERDMHACAPSEYIF